MEIEKGGQSTHESNTSTEESSLRKNTKKVSLVVLIVAVITTFVLGGIVGYFLGSKQNSSATTQYGTNSKSQLTSDLKTYTNDFYHISFQIPSDWKIEDFKKADGVPAFKLTSANGEISIATPLSDTRQEGAGTSLKSSNHIKQELDRTTVQLGEYSMPRSRYINDFDETVDYISMYNIPFQKVVNLAFTVKGDYETNNQILLSVLRTFKFTQKEASLDTLISYQLPEGWKSEQSNPANETADDSLSFISPDYQPIIGMGIDTGANLRISRHLKDPRKSIIEIIKQGLPLPLENESSQAKPVKVGAVDGLNLFICWEGCYDGYYIEQGDYYWVITFLCAKSCSTKAEMDASKYAKDRDTFLNSFKFK
jgi:hypothetical protein